MSVKALAQSLPDSAFQNISPPVPELVVLYQHVFARLPQGRRITEHRARHLFKSPVYTPPGIPDALQKDAGAEVDPHG